MVVFKSECPKRCWTCFKVIPASKHRLACVCLKPWIFIGRRSLPSTILISHFLGKVLGIGFLNSFSKMYLVFGFCFFHFFKILFVFLSRLISSFKCESIWILRLQLKDFLKFFRFLKSHHDNIFLSHWTIGSWCVCNIAV